ncbi:ribonuclease domain-containing protein [Oscillospiraceae bacterium MB08-C2-2]|nr:ribonuclease domain-containing protein [Oscillospiraceae bacterium MB08-C2-2]
MYVKKMCGYVLPYESTGAYLKGLLDFYDPPTTESTNWKHWITQIDFRRCRLCMVMHGKIYAINEVPEPEPPLHYNCRCDIVGMKAVLAGKGTKDGFNGADWWIKSFAALPDYYISKEALEELGWRRGKSPVKFAQGKMATMGVYRNDDGHLPQAPGRIWHEADINYYSGKRNRHRLLWSNDGLTFVTYNHYETFAEIL